MKKLTYLILAVGLLFTFAACDDNEPQYTHVFSLFPISKKVHFTKE